MKHILNNLTEEEKNAIREQHTGGMKVMNENFSKLINSKLGDSKPLVNEQELPQLGTKEFNLPQLGTKEFNDLASTYFGGKPRQETLEEAAKNYAIKKRKRKHLTNREFDLCQKDFIEGAKWQQERM